MNTAVRTLLSIFGLLALSACSDTDTSIPDDPFEPNQDSASATPTQANTAYEGRLWNDDWFSLEITAGNLGAGMQRVVANLVFSHADGDIDLELYDAGGNIVATADSTDDNERIDALVAGAGVYYLKVFSGDGATGNSYTLSWMLDDVYEPNDSSADATAATAGTDYAGVQFDDDWYRIDVTTGFERVVANLAFVHGDGDIDLELYDNAGNVLYRSDSDTDNEQVDFDVISAGTYYLRVFDFGNGSGNTYTLNWTGLQPPPADDPYEDNDDFVSATALPEDTAFIGVQLDDDWYRISVLPGFLRVAADLGFMNADGDIDLELYDMDGTSVLATSESNSDDFENIVFDVAASGDYYLRVYDFPGVGTANSYSLVWDGREAVDDLFEENDDLPTAADLAEGITISGIQLDEDWYRIDVTPGSQHLLIDLTFVHASGDLDIELLDSAGNFIAIEAIGRSGDDNETIDYVVASGGTYHLRIYDGTVVGGSTGNNYDLVWTSSP